MANPLISYGWGSGGFPGGMNSTALPNAGAGLARSYPSWLNQYGYQGSMADNAPKTFADPGVDPYSLLPSHAASPDTAPQLAGAGGGNNGFQIGNTEGGAATFDAGDENPAAFDNPNPPTSMRDFIGQIPGRALDFAGAIGGALSGAGPGGMSADQGDITSEARGMYRGGIVTRNRLTGPDPDGPDDGYAPLNIGEGVLTDAALKHYGKGIVARLNKLQVDKNKLTGK